MTNVTSGMNAKQWHICYSVQEKVKIIEQAQLWMLKTGMILSLSAAENFKHTSTTMLSRWMKQLPELKKDEQGRQSQAN